MLFKFCISLFLLVSFNSSIFSQNQNLKKIEDARILVLSKYKLQNFNIKNFTGRVITESELLNFKNRDIKIRLIGNNIILYIKNMKVVGQDYSFISDKNMNIDFISKGIKQKRLYRGSLDIRIEKTSLEIINETEFEDYVHSVAIAELGPLVKMKKKQRRELISAMEIAVRSYLLSDRNRHKELSYNYCDLTHCVYFPGLLKGKIKSLTKGQVLVTSDHKIITTYFHSTCGGVLSSPEIYWKDHLLSKNYRIGIDKTYSSKNHFCSKSPHFRWQVDISKAKISKIIGADIDKLKCKYLQRRVSELIYTDRDGKKGRISISKFLSSAGRKLGWNVIKSNSFKLVDFGKFFVFKGSGLGHGIGLCQWGASKQAKMGKSFEEILEFYYPKRIIKKYGKIK